MTLGVRFTYIGVLVAGLPIIYNSSNVWSADKEYISAISDMRLFATSRISRFGNLSGMYDRVVSRLSACVRLIPSDR